MPSQKDYKKLLILQAEKDKAENLLINNIEINRCENIKREMRINFKCNCGNIDNKNIRQCLEQSLDVLEIMKYLRKITLLQR